MKVPAKIVSNLRFYRIIISVVGRAGMLLLSLGLILFISYDTFKGINFLENRLYMRFQLWVCIIFLTDFLIQLLISSDRKRYLRRRWFFLLISIPYLNIIEIFDISFSASVLYYIRFIPLIRGAYSFEIVVGYISTNKAFSLLFQYAMLICGIVYFSSLMFFYEESAVNSNVISYWDALYWACMDATTVGSYIDPMTTVGKVLGVFLPVCSSMILPLFAVYVSTLVKKRSKEAMAGKENLKKEWTDELSELHSGNPRP